MKRYPVPIRYCWVCEKPANSLLSASHYEGGRTIWFCSVAHRKEYLWLARL